MKKLLLTLLLGLAALTQVPTASAIGTFGLFTCCPCRCRNGDVCIRPYNAFTPVLYGTVCLDPCCCQPPCPCCQPLCASCGPHCDCGMPPGPMMPMLPGPMMAGQMPMAMPMPMAGPGPVPAIPASNEMPKPMPKGPNFTGNYPGVVPYGMVQPVGYYPAYYPGYGFGYAPLMPSGYYHPAGW